MDLSFDLKKEWLSVLEYAALRPCESITLNNKETKNNFNSELLDFLNASPTPFHAVTKMKSQLLDAGFIELLESEEWAVESNHSYFVTRNDSSIIAFHSGENSAFENGWRMVGAHTDSPCLKVKPSPDMTNHSAQLAVEVYGGLLLGPWFDRDLSLAGRVTFENSEGNLESRLINFKRPIASIPSLAIHLDRTANENRTINKQKELNLVLASKSASFTEMLKAELLEQYSNIQILKIYDWEISAYDTQTAAIIGLSEDYIVSARLDNLLSCFIGLKALLAADRSQSTLLVCNDHEEVGSQSACGAQGPMLRDLLERVSGAQQLSRILSSSMMISADNAHAVHPNFPEKHDANHGPKINEGPVIKVNANQRYATNSETSALFRSFCAAVDVPVQSFVSRNDMGCGSTIGPIAAGELGVPTIDVGCPQWGMHSIRETAGVEDAHNLCKVLTQFYNYSKPLKI